MKLITQLSRIFVGVLFIFSGFIKLNDPVGFSFKLDEYFSPDVLNLPFLQPFALSISIFIVILEVLLGLALLLGYLKKTTLWLLGGMIVFFTFLTFYSAYFNKVTDCGCFGDAIPLTPWQSFGKDVILTVLIAIVVINSKYIQPIFSTGLNTLVMLFGLAACVFFGNYVLNHLPAIDFRPYAEGKSIPEGMKSAEERGLQPTTYLTIYTLKNKETGKLKKVNSTTYMEEKWWEKSEWEIQSDLTKTEIDQMGYEPPIHDFVLLMNDRDITEDILQMERVFLVIAYDVHKTDAEAFTTINAFAAEAEAARVPIFGLSASLPSAVEEFRHEVQAAFPFVTADATTLKTIIRANPGLLELRKGTVVNKWHHNDIPSFSTIK